MAVSSPSLQTSFYAASSKFSIVKSYWCKQRSFRCKERSHSAWIIKSVMNDKESGINDDEALEPTRNLLERVFTQTQKLEDRVSQDLNLPHLELNLGTLESDLQTALIFLREKVEDLELAENKLLSEYGDLNQAKDDLRKREEALASTFLRQEELENELKQANIDLAFQATEIQNLKLQLENQDKEVTEARSALELKQSELDIMINELRLKTEEAANTESELTSKSQLLVETKELLNKQTLEIEELKKNVEEKDEELQIARTLFDIEEEKLKVVEGNLEKQTMDWLIAHEEVKNLANTEVNENLQEFTKVKKLLADVRLELLSSQKSLISSRKKMEDQHEVLEKKLLELEQHREFLSSHTKSLGDAEVEVESERVKLRLVEARNKELERDLSFEEDVIKELQNQLDNEKRSLLQATEEILVVRDELDRKRSEYESMRSILELKESELVEAKLEIQHLKSEHAFVERALKEKESELFQAQEMLSEVNQEIRNLKTLLSHRENKLTETTALLKEKDEQVEKIQNEQNETNLKYFEATTVIERIYELTDKVVSSIEHEGVVSSKEKQLETELDLIMETLRSREMEVLQTRRALAIKETELKMALDKVNERENEMKKMKQELTKDADDMRKLYEMAQEMIGEKSLGELAVEKLQLEAAQLEVEAATSALEKITEMSRELLRTTSILFDADGDLDVSSENVPAIEVPVSGNGGFSELKTEVARLSELTEKLLEDAGIGGEVLG